MASTMRIRTSTLSDGEKSDIIKELRAGKSPQEVARMFARDPSTISRLIKEFTPTAHLAKARLQASLSTLVERVVAKADVDQAIKVLQNANVGILAPEVKGGGGKGINIAFGVSVGADSLAAVSDVKEFNKPDALPTSPADTFDSTPIRSGHTLVGEVSAFTMGDSDDDSEE